MYHCKIAAAVVAVAVVVGGGEVTMLHFVGSLSLFG